MSASELVAFCSGISSVSGSRLMTMPAACVEALRATPSSCSRDVDHLVDALVALVHLAERRGLLQGFLEGDAERGRDGLGDAVDLAVAVAHDPADVAYGRPGEHGAEGDDLGHVVLAVLAGDVVDDLVTAGILEVDVDVRHGHAVGVEEALERAGRRGWGRPA